VRLFLIGGAVVIALLLGAAGVLWFYGSPQASTVASPAGTAPAVAQSQQGAPPGAAPESAGGDSDVSVTSTVAPPPDPNTPLAIEIPGCVCHSDDPDVVEEHSQYRMNQCMGCHAGQIPTGE
jgi:hypothetical protein